MKRIIDIQTGSFLRDDFTFDEETEIALDVEPAQGLYQPKWDFELKQWVEGATQAYIDSLTPTTQEPTIEERVSVVERNQDEITTILADVVGVTL